MGISDDLVRLSVGVEDIEDLLCRLRTSIKIILETLSIKTGFIESGFYLLFDFISLSNKCNQRGTISSNRLLCFQCKFLDQDSNHPPSQKNNIAILIQQINLKVLLICI